VGAAENVNRINALPENAAEQEPSIGAVGRL
jgi:hypothetical protein